MFAHFPTVERPKAPLLRSSTHTGAFRRAVALYSYSAQGPDELTMSEGDVLDVVDVEGDWIRARLHGASGMVPASYVEYKTVSSSPSISRSSSRESTVGNVVYAAHAYQGRDASELSFEGRVF